MRVRYTLALVVGLLLCLHPALAWKHGSSVLSPVVLSSVSSGTPTSAAATITWTNTPAAKGHICYGLTASYELGCTTPDASPVTSDTASLFFLTASTIYHYQAYASAPGYLTGVSGDQTFTTAASSTAVVISLISTVPSSTSALVHWVNTPGAQGQVCTGPNGGPYTSCTTRDATNIVDDTATLSGLSPSTTYYYEINATATGYTQGFSIPAQQTFTTPASGTIYYVDSVAGVDTQDGTEQTHTTTGTGPWLRAPGDPKATGVPLSKARTLQPNDEVQIKGGQVYYGNIAVGSIGTLGNNILFEGSGWNGQVQMTGLTIDCLTFTSDPTFSGVSDATLPTSPNMVLNGGLYGTGVLVPALNAYYNIITIDPVTSCTPGATNPATISGSTIFMANNGASTATPYWNTSGFTSYTNSQVTNLSGTTFTFSDPTLATQLAGLSATQIANLVVSFYDSGTNNIYPGAVTGTVGSPITGINVNMTASGAYNTCGAACKYVLYNNPNNVNQSWVTPAYAIGYSSTGSFTPVFGTNTISGLTAANFPLGSAVVFYVTGGSLPAGVSPGTPYLINTSSSTAATIGSVSAPKTPLTFTGPGTGTQSATGQNLLMTKIAPGSYYVGVSTVAVGFASATGGSHFTIDGFEMFGWGGGTGEAVFTGNINGIHVTNNNIHDCSGPLSVACVRIVGNPDTGNRISDVVVSNNTIGPNTFNIPGLNVNGSSGATVTGNTISFTGFDPIYSQQDTGMTISGNYLHDSMGIHNIGITQYGGGNNLTPENQNNTITNNYINNVTAGLLQEGTANPVITPTSASGSGTQVTFSWSSPSFTWPVGFGGLVIGKMGTTALNGTYVVQSSTTTSVTVNNTTTGTLTVGGTITQSYDWYNDNYVISNNFIRGVSVPFNQVCMGDGGSENGASWTGNICDSGSLAVHPTSNAMTFGQNDLYSYTGTTPPPAVTYTNNAAGTCTGLTNPSPCPGTAVPPNTAPNSGNVVTTALGAAISALPAYDSGPGPFSLGATICAALPTGTFGVKYTCP